MTKPISLCLRNESVHISVEIVALFVYDMRTDSPCFCYGDTHITVESTSVCVISTGVLTVVVNISIRAITRWPLAVNRGKAPCCCSYVCLVFSSVFKMQDAP